MTETRLKDYCGQRCDVVVTITGSDTRVRFESDKEYGYPSMDLAELEKLISKIRTLQEVAAK